MSLTRNDLIVLDSVISMLAENRPEGLNFPGVARLLRRLEGEHRTYQRFTNDAARLLRELKSEEGASLETWDHIKDWLKEFDRAVG